MQLDMIKQYNLLNVRLDEDIDHHGAVIAREAIDCEISRRSIKNLAFDFSNVAFMDSSGIGMIMGRYRLMKLLGGRVFIYGASSDIKRIITMSGIHRIVTIRNTLEECFREEYIDG